MVTVLSQHAPTTNDFTTSQTHHIQYFHLVVRTEIEAPYRLTQVTREMRVIFVLGDARVTEGHLTLGTVSTEETLCR